MNLVFRPNSTFLHCSYLTLFNPPNFLISLLFSLSPGYYSRLKRNWIRRKFICIFLFSFFFFFLEWGEVGGEKGVLQWWIVEKKSLFAVLKSVSYCSTRYFLVLVLISVGVISILRLSILLSFQYPSTSSPNKSKKLGLWSNSYGISCLTVVGL